MFKSFFNLRIARSWNLIANCFAFKFMPPGSNHMNIPFRFLFAAFGLLTLVSPTLEAHEHLAAGASGSSLVLYLGDQPLSLDNPTIYHMVWRPENSTRTGYDGYYSLDEFLRSEYPNDYFTFSALSDGDAEPSTGNNAPTGTLVKMRILSVSGPTGARFGFWDVGRAGANDTPTASFLADGSSINFSYVLSEPLFGVPQAEQDPYGHIHGRGFTADMAGNYTVEFQLYDGSGLNLVNDSPIYTFNFVAVPEPGTVWLVIAAATTVFVYRRKSMSAEIWSAR